MMASHFDMIVYNWITTCINIYSTSNGYTEGLPLYPWSYTHVRDIVDGQYIFLIKIFLWNFKQRVDRVISTLKMM